MSLNQGTQENNGFMKVDKKKVLLAAIGTIITTAISGFGDPFREWLIFESGYTISWINYLDKLYQAISMSVTFFVIMIFGTLGAEAFGQVNKTITENNRLLAESRSAANDLQGKDQIEAEKKHVSLSEYKQKKYGDANYDYGKSAEERAAAEAERQELQQRLAALNAQLPPAPAPVAPAPITTAPVAPTTTAATTTIAPTTTATTTPTQQQAQDLLNTMKGA